MTKNNLDYGARSALRSLTVSALSACVMCLFAFLPSCGGGTDGSGVRSFGGQVISETARPLAGATVTVEETGASTVTAEDGSFELSTTLPAGTTSATFIIEDMETSARGTLDDVGDAGEQVSVLIVVDRPANTAQIIPVATPTPKPTATASSFTPTAAPTATSAPVVPGATATPTATPTSIAILPTATSTPTATPTPPESDECRCDRDLNSYVNANDFQTAINEYAVGNFDFDGNGLTQSADLQAFIDLCDPLTGERCYEHQ